MEADGGDAAAAVVGAAFVTTAGAVAAGTAPLGWARASAWTLLWGWLTSPLTVAAAIAPAVAVSVRFRSTSLLSLR